MSRFSDLAELLETAAKLLREADTALTKLPMISRKLDDLHGWAELPNRCKTALRYAEIYTVNELTSKSVEDLRELRRLGMTSIQNIRNLLSANELKLKGD